MTKEMRKMISEMDVHGVTTAKNVHIKLLADYKDASIIPNVKTIENFLGYKRKKRFNKLNDLESVRSLLADPEFSDIILYPKKEENYPTADGKWFILIGNEFSLSRFNKYGKDVFGFDSCYKFTKYHFPL